MKDNRPICPHCKKECSPSGGTVGGDPKERESYWTCWDCNYKIIDIPYEDIRVELGVSYKGRLINPGRGSEE